MLVFLYDVTCDVVFFTVLLVASYMDSICFSLGSYLLFVYDVVFYIVLFIYSLFESRLSLYGLIMFLLGSVLFSCNLLVTFLPS